jgi:multisubunit Na+/H+ antiporter MnhF subunit
MLLSAVCILSDAVCILSACSVQVVMFSVHLVIAGCMLSDTVCILSACSVQVVMFSVHVGIIDRKPCPLVLSRAPTSPLTDLLLA